MSKGEAKKRNPAGLVLVVLSRHAKLEMTGVKEGI